MPLQQMRDGKRRKRGEQTEVVTALSDCVCDGYRRGTSLSHHLLWSFFFFFFTPDVEWDNDCQGRINATTLPEHTHIDSYTHTHIRTLIHTHKGVLEACCKTIFCSIVSIFMDKNGILILGDQRSSKTFTSSH